MKNIVCFGEVLWDMLPSGKKLGGAPLNVALRAQSVGNQVKVISAVGNDDLGKEILEKITSYSASIDHIQVNKELETSKVLVSLDEKGSATYRIKFPCAWDAIHLLNRDIEIVKNSDAFIYGSLIARNQESRETLLELLKYAPFKVFDINLRPPHYNLETLKKLMSYADFIKFNDDELFGICKDFGQNEASLEECMRFISKETNTPRICVTRGAEGAILLHNNEMVYNKGYSVTVADTVGSGDSFLAIVVSKMLEGAAAQETIDYASAMGAIVASKSGANPTVSIEEMETMLKGGGSI